MRAKLRDSVFFVETEDGLYVKGPHGSMELRGQYVYRWFEQLLPLLDGEHDVESAIDGLPSEKQAMIRSILDPLIEEDFIALRDGRSGSPALPDALRTRYRDQLSLIQDHTDAPVERFRAFREADLLVAGDGRAVLATLRTGLANGCRSQRYVSPSGAAPVPRGRLDAAMSEARREDPALSIEEAALAADDAAEEPLRALVRGHDVVVAASRQEPDAWLGALGRACFRTGTPLLPALFGDEGAVVGPFQRAGAGPCLRCLRSRWNGDPPAGGSPSPTLAPVVANIAAFEAFQRLTGIEAPETTTSVHHVDATSWSIETRPLESVPACPVCQRAEREPLLEPVQLELDEASSDGACDRPLPDPEELFPTVRGRLVDPRVGVLASLSEGAGLQEPLHRCRAEVNPCGDGDEGQWVTEAGTTPVEARRRAVKRALEVSLARPEGTRGRQRRSERRAVGVATGRTLVVGDTRERHATTVGERTVTRSAAVGLGRLLAWSAAPEDDGWETWDPAPGSLTPAARRVSRFFASRSLGWRADRKRVGGWSLVRTRADGEPVRSVVAAPERSHALHRALADLWLYAFAPGDLPCEGPRLRAELPDDVPSLRSMREFLGTSGWELALEPLPAATLPRRVGWRFFRVSLLDRGTL